LSTQDNIAVFRRLVDELINGGNLAAFDELFAPDFIEHELPPGVPPGREGTRQLFSMLHGAFPDLRAEIEDVVANDDKVVFRMTWRGTQTGSFIDIPPTGKQVAFGVFDMVRVADGKLAEHWGLLDQLSLMQQLGVIPTPEQVTT
jgi:predicted ester cyclase